MRVFATVLLMGLLAVPVMGQEAPKPTLNQLILDNLNLQIRVMQLEYQKLRDRRDGLQARLNQQKKQKAKVKPKKEEPKEERDDG